MFEFYLPGLRQTAESRMTSRCTVKRQSPTETTVVDGYEVPAWEVVHADLPCRFPPNRGGASNSRKLNLGDVEVILGVREMHVDYFTDGLADGDLVEVTVGRSAGAFWRIVDASPPPDDATAYRLDVVAAQQPSGWS